MLNTSSEKDDYGEQAKEEAEEEEAHPWSTHYQFPSQPSFFEQNLSIRTQHSPISERRSSTSSTSYSSGMYTECERSSPILSAPHIYNSNVSPPSLPSLRSVLSSSSVTYLLPLDQNNKLPPLQSDFPQSAVPGDSHTTNQDNQWREHQQRLEAEFSNTLSLREHKLRRSRARCGGPLPRSKTRIQGQSTRYPTLSPTIPAGPRRSRVDIPPPKRKPIHSNKAYTREQVHWTRCMKVDCDRKFEEMTLMWAKQFPGERGGGGGGGEEKISHQSLSSRTYRDNVIPLFNLRELIIRDRNGRIVMQPCKIRKDSSTPAEVMHSLAGRHPDMALHYDWVPEHVKATARAIIAEDEADPESSQYTTWSSFTSICTDGASRGCHHPQTAPRMEPSHPEQREQTS